jgi:hypothetical protein
MGITIQEHKNFPYGDCPFLKRVCDHMGSNIYIEETLPPRTFKENLNGQIAVYTRLPTLQHPLEKQVMSSRDLRYMRNFLQTTGFHPVWSKIYQENPSLVLILRVCRMLLIPT